MPVNSFANYNLTWRPRLGASDAPVYLALAALLENDILSGKLPRGLKLPPQRELADWLDIDFTTVTRAYNVCKEKKLIYGITGRGTFVSPAPADAIPDLSSNNAIYDLSTVGAFPMVSSGIAAAMGRIAAGGYLDRMFSYSDTGGFEHQLAAGRHLLEMNGIETKGSSMAIFAGAQNAIAVTLFSLFSPGDKIATDPYTYSNLIGSARMAHIKLVPVEGDEGGMSAEALDKVAAKHRIKGLFVMPNAANPTGITLGEERRDALAAVASAHSLTVIEDDISPFEPSPSRRSFFSRLSESTVYIAAFTAFLAPGFRIAYAVFPERFRERLMKGLHLLNIKAGSLDAEVISELVLSGAAQEIMEGKRKSAKEANEVFDSVFKENALGREAKKRALYPFFRTINLPPSHLSGPEIEAFFGEKGIRVMHSCRFAVDKAVQHDFLRVSISSMRSMHQLEAALHALKRVLDDYLRHQTLHHRVISISG